MLNLKGVENTARSGMQLLGAAARQGVRAPLAHDGLHAVVKAEGLSRDPFVEWWTGVILEYGWAYHPLCLPVPTACW